MSLLKVQWEDGNRKSNAGTGHFPISDFRPSDFPLHLIATGLIGEPVPPVMTSGGPENMNS